MRLRQTCDHITILKLYINICKCNYDKTFSDLIPADKASNPSVKGNLINLYFLFGVWENWIV